MTEGSGNIYVSIKLIIAPNFSHSKLLKMTKIMTVRARPVSELWIRNCEFSVRVYNLFSPKFVYPCSGTEARGKWRYQSTFLATHDYRWATWFLSYLRSPGVHRPDLMNHHDSSELIIGVIRHWQGLLPQEEVTHSPQGPQSSGGSWLLPPPPNP